MDDPPIGSILRKMRYRVFLPGELFMAHQSTLSVIVLLAILCPSGLMARADEGDLGGILPVIPVVPEAGPRIVSDWTESLPRERSPVSSFVETLKPTDAAIEVVVGQSRLITTKADIDSEDEAGVVGVSDPTVLEFDVMPNPRMIRLLGLRAGVTDLSFTLSNGETYTFEVHVVYDINLISAQLKQVFPDADLRLAQLRDHLVVEGQARGPDQVAQILSVLESYITSIQVPQKVQGESASDSQPPGRAPNNNQGDSGGSIAGDADTGRGSAEDEVGGGTNVKAKYAPGRIINLIRVPGIQQVLIQVQIAELNRTGLREIGAHIGGASDGGRVLGTNLGAGIVSSLASLGVGGVSGTASAISGQSTTAFGIFPGSDIEFALNFLRENALLRVLAEPNLISLSGHKANFLAGGEFPVPVPQGGGGFNNTTIQFREFGVRLDFIPYVLDDDTVRLSVMPEVSSLDFSLGTTLIEGGDPVPGLSTRRAATTVELREGQTLAIAGLLQLELAGNTARIPGLGDVPYIGPFFSNNSQSSVEKELLVLVTPHLVAPLSAHEQVSLPGEEIVEPSDAEFYLMGRVEGRTGRYHRSAADYETIQKHLLIRYEQRCMQGQCGYSR